MKTTDRKRFAGKVVIITGASSGLGLATARAFVREGARVTLTARHGDRLQQAASELQHLTEHPVLAVPGDVSNREHMDGFVGQVVEKFGGIDILVNNAGAGMIAPFEQVAINDVAALWQTNFVGALQCTQAVLPHMRRRGTGHIINVASLAGLRGIPNSSIYSATKAALITFSDALRLELKPWGVAVTTICPGRIRLADTQFFASARKYGPVDLYKVSESLTADQVARALVHAAATRKRLVVLPFHAWLLHTVNKFAPQVVDRLLYKNMPRIGDKQSENAS